MALNLLLLLLAGNPVSTSRPTPQGDLQRGLEIAQLVENANNGFIGERSEMEMILINAHGDRTVRKLTSEVRETEKDGDLSRSTFLWPADVKGTQVLTWSHKQGDDDQWLFLPSMKRVKRISSSNKSGAFMGSEFAFEDLGSQELEKYTYALVEESERDGRPCWLLERVPTSPRSGYSRERVWMDREYMNPLRIEYFDRKGELLKVAQFSEYTAYGKLMRAGRIDMENVQTGKKSVISWSKRELGVALEENLFSSTALGQ
jgi:hypothetical protein